MAHGWTGRLLLAGMILALAGLTVACENNVQREMRKEREALKKSGELDELEDQLNTTNPDPYKSEYGFPPASPRQAQ